MRQISEFLNKFKNLGLEEKMSKEVIVESVSTILGPGFIAQNDISIRQDVALIKVGGPLKSELILRKEEILSIAREKSATVFKFKIKDLR
jgi:hypothetical protein